MEQIKKIELNYPSCAIGRMIKDIEKLKKEYPKAKIYIRVSDS